MKKVVAAVLLVSLNACYMYVPLGGEVPPSAGTEVRARLSPTQDFDVGEATVRDVRRVDGVVYRATTDTLAVWSSWLYTNIGSRYSSAGQVFYLDRANTEQLEVRKFQPVRTVVGLALGLGAGFGLLTFIADAGSGGNNDGGDPDVQTRVQRPYR